MNVCGFASEQKSSPDSTNRMSSTQTQSGISEWGGGLISHAPVLSKEYKKSCNICEVDN